MRRSKEKSIEKFVVTLIGPVTPIATGNLHIRFMGRKN